MDGIAPVVSEKYCRKDLWVKYFSSKPQKAQFLFKGCNSFNKRSVKYAQWFELIINPVKFQWNWSSSLGGVAGTNFKNKKH